MLLVLFTNYVCNKCTLQVSLLVLLLCHIFALGKSPCVFHPWLVSILFRYSPKKIHFYRKFFLSLCISRELAQTCPVLNAAGLTILYTQDAFPVSSFSKVVDSSVRGVLESFLLFEFPLISKGAFFIPAQHSTYV